MADVTQILSQIEEGDPEAAEKLLPLVYDELRKLAAAKMAQEKPGQTLQATGLVHEAYLRLVDADGRSRWDSRRHFFGAAARSMQQILVENARRKHRAKHGGDHSRVDVDLVDIPTTMTSDDLLALNEALERLRREEPVKAELVVLRYFGGMTTEQAAELLGISRVTAHRYWTFARAWLHQQVSGESAQ